MCELKGLMLSGEVQAARGRQQDTGGFQGRGRAQELQKQR